MRDFPIAQRRMKNIRPLEVRDPGRVSSLSISPAWSAPGSQQDRSKCFGKKSSAVVKGVGADLSQDWLGLEPVELPDRNSSEHREPILKVAKHCQTPILSNGRSARRAFTGTRSLSGICGITTESEPPLSRRNWETRP